MSTKTLAGLISAVVLAASAAAAVEVIDPALISEQGYVQSSADSAPSAPDALFVLQQNATPGNLPQKPAGVVRLTR